MSRSWEAAGSSAPEQKAGSVGKQGTVNSGAPQKRCDDAMLTT
jgi:hypothetical protein